MDKLPELERLSESEKNALITTLWAEVQRLKAQLAALDAKPHEPRKDAHNSSVPPSHSPKRNRPAGPRTGTRRDASVGRAGGGRPLHPEPDQVIIAQAKTCPHGGGPVQAHEPHPHAVYDTIELPPVTPFGASIQSLATYLRFTHAISYARLSALFTQVYGVSISEGALANLFQRVNTRLDDRVAEILTRLRSSRLICIDETGARVNGRTQWQWVFQHAEVCVHVIRPSRGHGVIREILGDHRPTIWVSDLYSAQRHHPAADWQVCLAHQLRDCQFALEAGDTLFAPRMKAILLRAFAIHQRRDTLAASTLYQYR